MTRNRQAQAAARSTPHGTCARREVGRAGGDRPGLGRRSARIAAHWWASRSAMPSSSRGAAAAWAAVVGSAGRAGSASSGLLLGWLPRRRRRPRCSRHRLLTASATSRRTSRYAASRVRLGEQPGRGQHVVVVDHDPRRAGAAASRSSTSARCCRPSTRSATPGRPLRSTPPEPTSRSTSRRSLPVRSTTRPSGLTTTRDRPACRRSARPTAARAIASSRPASASSAAGSPGRSWRRLPASARSSSPAASTVDDRRPAHAEVALDGAGDRRGGDDLAGEAALGVPFGVELDDAVDVGGGAADVDDDHVARPRGARRRGRGRAARPR